MKSYQISIKDIIIIALAIFGVYWFLLKPTEEITTVKETQQIDIEKIVQTAINTALQHQQPQQQPVIIYQDGIKEVQNIDEVPDIDKDKFATLNKYQDTTIVKSKKVNGKIFSEILSDGKVFSNKITTELEVQTITKTIEKETIKYPSGLFIEPSIYANPSSLNFTTGLQLKYLYKSNFGVGLGFQFNTLDKGVYYGLSVSKKLL